MRGQVHCPRSGSGDRYLHPVGGVILKRKGDGEDVYDEGCG
jgi:hypothetical protein